MNAKSINFFSRMTIRTRMVFILLLVSVTVLGTYGVFTYIQTKTRLTDALEYNANMAADQLAKTLLMPLWYMDDQLIDGVILSFMMEKEIQAILIKKKDASGIYRGKIKDIHNKIIDVKEDVIGGFIRKEREIIKDSKSIGVVEVFLTTRFMQQELKNYLIHIVFMVIVLNFGLLWAFLFSLDRMMIRPFRYIITGVNRIRDGDLTIRIDIQSWDEVGELAEAINAMCLGMAEIVGENLTIAETLTKTAAEHADSIRETSSALKEITAITKQNAENAGQADMLMKQGMQVIESAGRIMFDLNSSMSDLTHAANEISKVIKTIDEIAFQTGLLALNAAVEAARSGEAGAGFAVVAEEVRNLSKRSADSAKNTSGMARDAIEKVASGTKLVEKMTRALSEVVDLSNQVGNMMNRISVVSYEQAHRIDQISGIIIEMDTMTRKHVEISLKLKEAMKRFIQN